MTIGKSGHLVFVSVLVGFLVACSGCATYRRAALPGSNGDVPARADVETIRKGSNVRVTLRSGESVTGEVAWFSPDELALGNRGNYGFTGVVLKVTDINYIEIRDQTDGQIEGAWFIALGVLALIGALIELQNLGLN